MRVLADIDTASLKSTPAHLSVEGKVQETRMSGKPTIFIHHKVLEVVADGDGTRTGGNEVGCSSWEGPRNVALCDKLIDGASSSGRPREGGRG